MIADKRLFFRELFNGVFKISVAGLLIGFLKSHDILIAILLGLKVLFNIYFNIIKPKEFKNWILLVGMIITGIGGLIGETWGVRNGYWTYHNVERILPMWLPFAWMLAFYFLYKLESKLILTLSNPSFKNKIILAFFIALVFPALGEMITIELGVWTYYWPYQILGVPVYAFACLVGLHMFIYFLLHILCKSLKIKDTVFY